MKPMTHKERFLQTLARKPVDLLPHGDGLWGETYAKYVAQGKLKEGADQVSHFDMSWRGGGWLNSLADIDFKDEVLEETEETKLVLNGNGATMRTWKQRSGTPEHIDFKVKDRAAWNELIKPHLLKLDRRRIPFDSYRAAKQLAAEEQRAFVWAGVAPFEQMHPICGHEYMLMGMALDPDWVKDMVNTYANLTLMHLETLFAEEGLPDAMWFYEDMGFKERPFMSPAMYEEIVMPGHKKLFDYAHAKGLKVIVHSCGFVEPLVPGLVRAGMDCLQAMEVKAGMDVLRIAKNFGDRLTFCGNLDIRIVASNDRRKIMEELERKILPVLKMGSGFIVHSDHSIPPEVEHDTLRFFFDEGAKMARRVWHNNQH
ncbi:MAG: uroporphyrinogen decarboxylase family protein [Kiritimatiellae bacterium]|nr:uroporphyrinogen decarboxylase family protein [Kiritimatiellia bacterium]